MITPPKYSVIIPVYNRPEEVAELLESLLQIRRKDLEIIIVEDGSTRRCKTIAGKYAEFLPVRYFLKQNEGPGPARNFGYQQAQGSWFVAFDSDCIIPPDYFDHVDQALLELGLDAWGGPDRAHETFTLLQRAMGYTMSSFFTTGGIRGGKRRLGSFQPRSFNMGISRAVFEKTGGFRLTHSAEDIEFSIRMKEAGFRVGLIEKAFVFHKRRTSLAAFFKQVNNFGRGRAVVGQLYPAEVKIQHWLPSIFTIALIALVLSPLVSLDLFYVGSFVFLTYLVAVFLDALVSTKNVFVALIAIPSALIQLTGYGSGFISERMGAGLKKHG